MKTRICVSSCLFHTRQKVIFSLRFHHCQELLEGVFNAALADRTQEGDRFIPPNPNTSYIVKLRNLVNEELFCEKGGNIFFFQHAAELQWVSSS